MMDKWKMAWEIYGALRLAGADIDDASVPIIGKVLGEYIEDEVPGRYDGNLTKWPVEAREAAPILLKALEMVQQRLEEKPGGIVAFSGEEWTQIDKAIAAAKEAAG